MLDPIASLITGINDAVKAQLFLPLMLLGLTIVGLIFVFGNHERAKERATWLAIGGAIILGGSRIIAAMQGVVH